MILKKYWNIGNEVIVETPDNKLRTGTISSLPFLELLDIPKEIKL